MDDSPASPSVTDPSLTVTNSPAFSSPSVTDPSQPVAGFADNDPRETRAIALDIERKLAGIEAFVKEIAEQAKPAIDQLTGSGIFRMLTGAKK